MALTIIDAYGAMTDGANTIELKDNGVGIIGEALRAKGQSSWMPIMT